MNVLPQPTFFLKYMRPGISFYNQKKGIRKFAPDDEEDDYFGNLDFLATKGSKRDV